MGRGEEINPMWRLHNYSVLWSRIPLRLFCLAEGHPTLFVGYNMFLVQACDSLLISLCKPWRVRDNWKMH